MSTTGGRLEPRVEILDGHLDAENRHDLDAILDTYGRDPTVTINGQVFAGLASIRRFHERLGFSPGGSFSDLQVGERRRYVSDQAVIIEQTLSGRHTGTWQGLQATGRSFEVPVCTVYTFDEEGKLAGERVYFDSALLLKQLDVSP